MEKIFFIHGIDDSGSVFRPLQSQLQKKGRVFLNFEYLPNNGDAQIELLASQLADFIEKNTSAGEKVGLIAFSLGSMVARYYLQKLGGTLRVSSCIAISAPHYGSITAYFKNSPGIRQLRPGSSFLKDLNRDTKMLQQIVYADIYSPFDLMIIPFTSSILFPRSARKVYSLLHPWMLKNKKLHTHIQQLLER